MPLQATYAVASPTPTVSETAPTWNPVCHITYTRDTWVKLLELPSTYAYDEGKLLCQESGNTWVVWVPDCGEVILDRSDFYC
ncbi:MAG: hypothetical protein Fur0025_37370 [Oscillatoriaceae cyanobacterium]